MAKTPVAVSLLCCERIIIEEGTRNLTPVNCFVRREAQAFPAEPFPFVVIVTMTDGFGEMPIQIRIDRLDTMEDIYNRQGTIQFASPLRETVYCFRIRDCHFPVSGDYEISVFVNKELLANRKIKVLLKGNDDE